MLKSTLGLLAIMVLAVIGTEACGALLQGQYAMVPGATGRVAIPVSSMVYITAHGKTYHTSRQCMSLAKSDKVLQTTAALAEAHGITECKICLHRGAVPASGKKAGSKTFDNSWADYKGAK